MSTFQAMVILPLYFCPDSVFKYEVEYSFTSYHTMHEVVSSYKTLFLENNLGLALMILNVRVRVQN